MYREHDGGIWSGLDEHDKNIRTITTLYWLAIYYTRINKISISNKFSCGAMTHIFSIVGIDNLTFLKWFIISFFPKAHEIYHKFKTKVAKLI